MNLVPGAAGEEPASAGRHLQLLLGNVLPIWRACAWQFLKASLRQGEEVELRPKGRTGSLCTVCREMGYKLVRDAGGTSERGGEAQPAMEAGGRILERWCKGPQTLVGAQFWDPQGPSFPECSSRSPPPTPPADYKLLCDFLPLPW